MKADAGYMADGFGYVFASPLRWKGKDFLYLGATVGGVFLSSFLDEPFLKFADKHNNPKRFDRVEFFADLTGKPRPAVIAFSVIYGIGVFKDVQWMRDSGVLIVAALGSTVALQTFSKWAVGRARPSARLGYDVFEPFNPEPAFHSFPSGHAMASLAITSIVARQVKSKVLKVMLYGVGFSTGFARAFNTEHWVSDVVLSNVLTFLAVKTASDRYNHKKELKAQKQQGQLSLMPISSGLRLTYKF